ncbi:hypothetical protein [Actinoplanes sp. NPDC023714]|uniref:hypothetical protein n=1 Tax=Actinoplanes sp. NPDC023714 TaxID=3154322 RepID=UPI0033EB0A20
MDWSGWDTALKVLRDPLTALFAGVFLALLAARALRLLVRWTLIIAALGLFVWALIRYEAVRDVTVTGLGVGLKALLALFCLIAVVAVAAIVAVVVMYLHAEAAGRPRDRGTPLRHPAPEPDGIEVDPGDAGAATELVRAAEQVNRLSERLMAILERVFEGATDTDRAPQAAGILLRGYFTGLRPWQPEIRRIHHDGDLLLRRLATTLPGIADQDRRTLIAMSREPVWLPDRHYWQELADDVPVPYFAVRVLCLNRRWREVATVLFKTYYAGCLIAEYAESA